MLIEYSRTRNNVIPPTRANPSDAGLDVYFNPEHSGSTTLNPGESKRLQTGLRFGIPHGFMLQVMNRSSVASKCNLIVGAQVVDSGFNGEVFVDILLILRRKIYAVNLLIFFVWGFLISYYN